MGRGERDLEGGCDGKSMLAVQGYLLSANDPLSSEVLQRQLIASRYLKLLSGRLFMSQLYHIKVGHSLMVIYRSVAMAHYQNGNSANTDE